MYRKLYVQIPAIPMVVHEPSFGPGIWAQSTALAQVPYKKHHSKNAFEKHSRIT